VDAATSGYSGSNVTKGALGEFIRQVDSKRISTPCILVVEQLDRLTRKKLRDARKLFEGLLEKGVKICTTHNGKVYDESSLDSLYDIQQSMMELNAAYEYAASIGRRSGERWKEKKRLASNGEVMTKQVPAWLQVVKGKIVPIPERVKVVKSIFADYINGRGYRSIAGRLNQAKVPTWGRSSGWNPSYIANIITKRTVLGEYQPHNLVDGKQVDGGEPIANYYPAVIDLPTFNKAELRFGSNKKTSGRKVKMNNLFSGLVKCTCGASMTGCVSHGYSNLVCYNASRGECKYSSMRYTAFESAMLTVVKDVLLPELVDSTADDSELIPLYHRMAEDIKTIDRLNKALATTDDPPKSTVQLLNKTEADFAAVKKVVSLKQAEMNASVHSDTSEVLNNLHQNLKDVSYRIKVNAVLSRIIDKIVMDNANKSFAVYPKDRSTPIVVNITTDYSSFMIQGCKVLYDLGDAPAKVA